MSQINHSSVKSHYGRVGRISQGRQASSVILPMNKQHIPIYKKPGYNALTHNNGGNGFGYYNVKNAYNNYGNNCTQVGVRGCNGDLKEKMQPQKCSGQKCAPYSQTLRGNTKDLTQMNYAMGFDHHACEQLKEDGHAPFNCKK